MNQHLISEVYLKQFGYQDSNSQWRICTLERSKLPIMIKTDKKWISHKSISSFLSIDNYFDFENYDDLKFTRVIEETSAEIESLLPMLIKELQCDEKITQKGEAILAHYISNLYVRTSNFDLLLDDLIKLEAHDLFLRECLTFNDESYKNFVFEIFKDPKFNTNKNIKNLSRFLFWNYFWQRLAYFEYYILKPFEGKGWISSDNPVILNNHVNEHSLISFETEIIFPFSKSILILFKNGRSKHVSKIFENTLLKGVSTASSEINDIINNIIMDNVDKFLIVPGLQNHYTF